MRFLGQSNLTSAKAKQNDAKTNHAKPDSSQICNEPAWKEAAINEDKVIRLDGLVHDCVAFDWVAKIVLAVASHRDFADFRQDHQPPLDQSRLMYRRADHIHWRQFSVKCVA